MVSIWEANTKILITLSDKPVIEGIVTIVDRQWLMMSLKISGLLRSGLHARVEHCQWSLGIDVDSYIITHDL